MIRGFFVRETDDLKIAQRFIAGIRRQEKYQVPWGRLNASVVPAGLRVYVIVYPPINRWAIIKCPYGTSLSCWLRSPMSELRTTDPNVARGNYLNQSISDIEHLRSLGKPLEPSAEELAVLSSFERFAFRVTHRMNQGRWKRFWTWCQSGFGAGWIYISTYNLMHVYGLENIEAVDHDRPILLVANHRSFFDFYTVSSVLFYRTRWRKQLFFPVRGRFFYQSVAGMFVNLIMGWWSMYPPFFESNRPTSARSTGGCARKAAISTRSSRTGSAARSAASPTCSCRCLATTTCRTR